MKVALGIRVVLVLLWAVFLPLGQAHCALAMADVPTTAAIHTEHPEGDDDCCSEPDSHSDSSSPTDGCCCDIFQLPSATSPASITVDTPTSVLAFIAVVPAVAITVVDRDTGDRLDALLRSGIPPDPSADPQAPRSPPQSA